MKSANENLVPREGTRLTDHELLKVLMKMDQVILFTESAAGWVSSRNHTIA